jgi:ribosomal protein S20
VGVVKKEKASRKRSRLQLRLNKAAAPATPAAKK